MNRKVALINSTSTGSTGRIAQWISGEMQAQGFQTLFAYGRGPRVNENNKVCFTDPIDIAVHGLSTRLLDRHGLQSENSTRRLLKRLEEYKPTILQLHNLHGYYVHFPMLFDFIARRKLRVIWTLHDCWAFTGHCTYFSYIACERWELGCSHCPQKKEYPKSVLIDRSKSNWEDKRDAFLSCKDLTIVTPSKWLNELANRSFLNQSKRIITVNNGIDVEKWQPKEKTFARERLGIEKDAFVILGVAASFAEIRKGFVFFRQMLEWLGAKEEIILIGKIPNIISDFGDKMKVVPPVSSIEELALYYSAADVFCNPTLEDNFPTVNLEALACGVPVVAFDTGGCRETVIEGEGIIVQEREALTLLNAARYFASESEEKRAERSEIARQRFDKKNMGNKYCEICNNS